MDGGAEKPMAVIMSGSLRLGLRVCSTATVTNGRERGGPRDRVVGKVSSPFTPSLLVIFFFGRRFGAALLALCLLLTAFSSCMIVALSLHLDWRLASIACLFVLLGLFATRGAFRLLIGWYERRRPCFFIRGAKMVLNGGGERTHVYNGMR